MWLLFDIPYRMGVCRKSKNFGNAEVRPLVQGRGWLLETRPSQYVAMPNLVVLGQMVRAYAYRDPPEKNRALASRLSRSRHFFWSRLSEKRHVLKTLLLLHRRKVYLEWYYVWWPWLTSKPLSALRGFVSFSWGSCYCSSSCATVQSAILIYHFCPSVTLWYCL